MGRHPGQGRTYPAPPYGPGVAVRIWLRVVEVATEMVPLEISFPRYRGLPRLRTEIEFSLAELERLGPGHRIELEVRE